MKSSITAFIILLCISTSLFAQTDSSDVDDNVKTPQLYPQDFPGNIFRFKPFLVAQSTLSAEYEFFSKNKSVSYVIAFEATLLQTDRSEIKGGGLELDRRMYFDRSLGTGENSETMFYISYGAKFNHYQIEYSYYEDDYYYDPYYGYSYPKYSSTESIDDFVFNKLSLNLKVGVQFVAFKKISIDSNIGTGIRYNSIRNKPENYNGNYTFDAIFRHGIQPSIHFSVGLAN